MRVHSTIAATVARHELPTMARSYRITSAKRSENNLSISNRLLHFLRRRRWATWPSPPCAASRTHAPPGESAQCNTGWTCAHASRGHDSYSCGLNMSSSNPPYSCEHQARRRQIRGWHVPAKAARGHSTLEEGPAEGTAAVAMPAGRVVAWPLLVAWRHRNSAVVSVGSMNAACNR